MIGLNNKKIGFIIDSSSNLKNGQFDDVMVVPLGVSVQIDNDIKSYKDGIDFNDSDLVTVLENKKSIVKTSQASMQDMLKVVMEACKQYDVVYAFPIHNHLSSNINTWRLLKEDFPNLNVVMTCDIGFSFAWTIQEVKDFLMANEGGEAAVQQYVDEQIISHRSGFLMVENLDQLIKGGRLKGVKAIIAKLFKIKPIIMFSKDGLIHHNNGKDHDDLFKTLDEHLSKIAPSHKITRSILFVPSNNDQLKTQYINEYTKHYGQIPYEVVNFPTVVSCHTGMKYVAAYVEFK